MVSSRILNNYLYNNICLKFKSYSPIKLLSAWKKNREKAGPSQVIYNSVDFYTEPLRKMRQTVSHNTTQVQGVMVEVKILNFQLITCNKNLKFGSNFFSERVSSCIGHWSIFTGWNSVQEWKNFFFSFCRRDYVRTGYPCCVKSYKSSVNQVLTLNFFYHFCII